MSKIPAWKKIIQDCTQANFNEDHQKPAQDAHKKDSAHFLAESMKNCESADRNIQETYRKIQKADVGSALRGKKAETDNLLNFTTLKPYKLNISGVSRRTTYDDESSTSFQGIVSITETVNNSASKFTQNSQIKVEQVSCDSNAKDNDASTPDNCSLEDCENLSAIFDDSLDDNQNKIVCDNLNRYAIEVMSSKSLSDYLMNLSKKSHSQSYTTVSEMKNLLESFKQPNTTKNSEIISDSKKSGYETEQKIINSIKKPNIPSIKSKVKIYIDSPGLIYIKPTSKILSSLFATYDPKKVAYSSKESQWTIDPEYFISIKKELKKYFIFEDIPQSLLTAYINSLSCPSIDKVSLNDHIDRTLLPFQKESVKFAIQRKGRLLLADEMGLGKTYQALAIAFFYRLEWPLLIISPASLLETWQNSITKLLQMPSTIVRKAQDLDSCGINLHYSNLTFNTTRGKCRVAHSGLKESENELTNSKNGTLEIILKDQGSKKRKIANSKASKNSPVKLKAQKAQPFHTGSSEESLCDSSSQDGIYPLDLSSQTITSQKQDSIYICSYDMATRFYNQIRSKKFQIIIADECHYLKTATSKRSSSLMTILQDSARLILLSGTPATSRPIELYTAITALYKSAFKTMYEYGYRYCNLHKKGNYLNWKGCSNSEELVFFLKSLFMIRRCKSEVMNQLPQKNRAHISMEISRKRINAALSKKTPSSKTRSFRKGSKSLVSDLPDSSVMEQYREVAGLKLKAVCSYLHDLLKSNHKIVVFAHHAVMLDGLEAFLKNKTKIMRIDGKTLTHYRQRLVDSFQTDDSIRVALLSLTACSTGLTLTAARDLVFAELYWTPGTLMQAEDRIHRIGQKNDVKIHFLTAKGTIDDQVWPLLKKKMVVLEKCGLGKNELEDIENRTVPLNNIRDFCVDETYTPQDLIKDIDSEAEDLFDDLEDLCS